MDKNKLKERKQELEEDRSFYYEAYIKTEAKLELINELLVNEETEETTDSLLLNND